MRLTLLEHEAEAPAGLIEAWAEARGHELVTTRVLSPASLPEAGGTDVLVSLGSDCSVARSPEPWIEAEIDLLRAAHAARQPILGVCFGGQALARALGGRVDRAPSLDPGWWAIESQAPDLISPGPWFRWHEDAFTVPPGAEELATVGQVPMAFRRGASFGLQFHPEVTPAIALAWIDGARAALAENEIDEGSLRERIVAGAPGAAERAFELFDRIAAAWASAGVL